MKIQDVMTVEVHTALANEMLHETARKMKAHHIGALPVTLDGRAVGIVTDRDIALRAVAEGSDPTRTPVERVMSKELHFCRKGDELEAATKTMEERGVRRLLVLDEKDRLAGIVSLGDIAAKGGNPGGKALASVIARTRSC